METCTCTPHGTDTCYETAMHTKLGLPIKQCIPHLISVDLNLKASTAMATCILVLCLLAGVHSAPTIDNNLIPGKEMLTSLVSSRWLPKKISCISKSREQWIIVSRCNRWARGSRWWTCGWPSTSPPPTPSPLGRLKVAWRRGDTLRWCRQPPSFLIFNPFSSV